jgi:hypothetical protein
MVAGWRPVHRHDYDLYKLYHHRVGDLGLLLIGSIPLPMVRVASAFGPLQVAGIVIVLCTSIRN